MTRRWVLASGNPGKLRELQALLAGLDVELVAQHALGVAPAEEPHPTFIENALAKARHAAVAAGLPALADDSGLCCVALGGAPGVRSARFARDHRAAPTAEQASDDANCAELLRQLGASADRRGHFVCVLAAVAAADDPEPIIAEGRWHGQIAAAPRGQHGFGYDPLFWLPQLQMTAAEIDPALKNRISHRARATRRLLAQLQHRWSC